MPVVTRSKVGPLVRKLAALSLLSLLAPAGCAETGPSHRYSRSQARTANTRPDAPGLVIGEYPLSRKPILDGDTIRVEGLDSTLRLLALDAEETFKSEQSRREVEADWERYLRERRGSSAHPVKSGTPMGEEAKAFAVAFFDGAKSVRLERDHPKEIRDRYGRYLVYIFVARQGRWVNYNIEAVRAGMSPYFTKYSYSRRFHDEFVAAEKEARAAQRGIWRPGAQSYGDYAERKPWWDARAEFIKSFERDAAGRDNFVVLSNWDSVAVLKQHIGRTVTVLGSVSRVMPRDQGPSRVMLDVRKSNDLALVFFDKKVFTSSGIERYRSEFVRATGVVNEYTYKYNGRRQLQLIINAPSQVVLSDVPGVDKPRQAATAGQ